MSEAAPPRSPPSQPPRLLFASHLLIPLKVSRSDHPTSPAMRRSWHHRRLAALAHDQLPKKHIATSTAVQRRSVNQGNAVNTTCKLLRCPPSTERATQTTQSRSQHRGRRRERRTVVGSPSNFASKLAHVVGVAFRRMEISHYLVCRPGNDPWLRARPRPIATLLR